MAREVMVLGERAKKGKTSRRIESNSSMRTTSLAFAKRNLRDT